MVFCKDEKPSHGTEDKFDIELNQLAAEYSSSPGSLATVKDRKQSQEASPETDGSMEGVTNDHSSFHFPAPPQFCNGLSGDSIKLVQANNTKLKILLVIATVTIIVSVVFGVVTVSLHYGKKADNSSPDDPDCDGLVARLEFTLKALADLRETLANLTRLSQDSSTSNPDNAVDQTWNSSPRYSWA